MRISNVEQKKIYTTTIADLKGPSNNETIVIMRMAEVLLVETRYDNWNNGTQYYQLQLLLKLSDYKNIENQKKQQSEKIILDSYSKFFDSENDILESVNILPKVEQQIDWEVLNGKETKNGILEKLNDEKQILIDVATNERLINDCESRFKILHSSLRESLSKLFLDHPIQFDSLWDWYNFYNKEHLETYRSRRKYINDDFAPLIKILEESTDKVDEKPLFLPTGWQQIDRSVELLEQELMNANDRIDLNQIGVRCRETIILAAKEVYDEKKHHPKSFPGEISDTDSAKMLEGFIEYFFGGQENDEKRRYAKVTNNLANNLAHKQNATLLDAKLCLSATLSLINVIKIIHQEFSKVR